MDFLISRYIITFYYASIYNLSNFCYKLIDRIQFLAASILKEEYIFHGGIYNISQIVYRTCSCIHDFRHFHSLAFYALKKDTIQNIVSRHPKITISFNSHVAIMLAARSVGFSILVSETKIHGSRETAGEVDVHDGISSTSLIGYRESLCEYRPGCVYGAQRQSNKEMHRAAPHSSAFRNFGKKTPMKKKLLLQEPYFFIRKIAYANAIIDIRV